MLPHDPPALAFVAALAVLVGVAAWTDLRQRRIPNWLSALTLVIGLAYVGWAVGGGWTATGLAALHAVVALIVTMGLFAVRAIGAGDAKFYTAISAWMPIGKGVLLLVSVALAGLVLLVIFYLARIRGRRARADPSPSDFDKLPYGIAIGIGGLFAVLAG